MAVHNITHYLQINGSASGVFDIITTPRGLDSWWTKHSQGRAEPGTLYDLDFGNHLVWQAQVTEMVPLKEFELTMTKCPPDWMGTSVRFELSPLQEKVQLRFFHKGWALSNDHYFISNYCWAMYLRILKRHVEFGELVAYEDRLIV